MRQLSGTIPGTVDSIILMSHFSGRGFSAYISTIRRYFTKDFVTPAFYRNLLWWKGKILKDLKNVILTFIFSLVIISCNTESKVLHMKKIVTGYQCNQS